MCTLVILASENRDLLHVGFNRDELHTRRPALPPAVALQAGVRTLTPTDADAGGTWIGATERGLVVALLNWFGPAPDPMAPVRSRGQLARDLLGCGDLQRALAALRQQHRAGALRHLPPFEVALAQSKNPAAIAYLALWDGQKLALRKAKLPLVHASSAWELAAVRRERRRALAGLLRQGQPPTDEALAQWFSSHAAGPSGRAICLHSPWALTHSHTQIRVGAGQAIMRYAPGPPCVTPLGEKLALPLRT